VFDHTYSITTLRDLYTGIMGNVGSRMRIIAVRGGRVCVCVIMCLRACVCVT
jgi:hypothetical protein